MTPEHFTSSTLGWFAAIAAIIQAPVSMFLWGKFKAMYLELKGDHAVSTAKIEDNTARLNRQGQAQAALLLASPPPGQPAAAPAPTTVNAPAAETVTLNTGDAAPADTAPADTPPADETPANVIAPTPEPAPENKSVVVDQDVITTAHAALKALMNASGSTDGPAVSAPGQPDLTPVTPAAPVEAPAPPLAPPTV